VIAPRDLNEAPPVADRIGVAGKVDLPNPITIDDAAIVTPIASTPRVARHRRPRAVTLTATFSLMEASALKQL
jgi:hypothetical protein